MTSSPRWRGASLGARLLALTLVPLGALALFGVQRVDGERDLAEQHADIVEAVALQRTVADVFPPAQLERIALEGLSRIDEVGVPRDVVVAFTGVDFEATYGENAVDLERSLDELQDTYRDLRLGDGSLLGDRLARVRGAIEIQRELSSDQRARASEVGEVFDELAMLLQDVLDAGVARTDLGEPTTLRQAQVERLGDVLASADDYGSAIVRGIMNRTAELRDATIGSLAVHEARLESFSALLDENESAQFADVRAQLVRADLAPLDLDVGAELALDPGFVQESTTIALGHLDYLRELHAFSTSFHSSVGDEVAADAAAASSHADRTTLMVIAVAVVSVLLALGVLWSVLVPIRRLTSRARGISEGDLDLPPIPLRGPGDLRVLTHTMNDMIDTLHEVDNEIGRLAAGQVDADRALTLPGGIGESIRSSFDRLAAVTDELQHSRELSDAIVSGADDAIWTVDDRGAIVTANAASAELVGLPITEQLEQHITDLLDRTTGEARILTAGRSDRTALVTRSTIEAGGDRRSVVIAHDISERTQFEERLAYQANHDALTGLPNRFAVLGHLERRLIGAEPIAVLFIDLDAFKAVNDAQGHAAGDHVLTEVAECLRGSVRQDEFVGRLGGDEFVVVTQRFSQTADITALGHRLIRDIEQPRVIGDRMFVLSASVGIATGDPGDAALDVIRRADNALYQAKRLGRGRVGVFDASMQERIEHETDLEMALRQAVRNDELVLHLQPMTDLASGVVNGAEALVRWERPGHGLVPPGEFIPIAERTSLIYEIERWVLHRAGELVTDWRRRDPSCTHRVAVNVSGRHLIEGDLLADVDAVLTLTGADPSMLELELTETQLLEDLDRATSVLDALRSKGITIAVDDFGTGYSSMTYLRELPIDAIKIDRSFVARATDHGYDSTVIEALLTIGRTLGLSVVAEGVETDAQLAYVRARGCDRAQGFLLAHPMPIADAETLLFDAEHVAG